MTTTLLSEGRKQSTSQLAFRLTLRPASMRAIFGAALLAVLLSLAALIVSTIFDSGVATAMLIDVTAVVGVALFMGNSGISSFGAHVGFLGLAAYLSGLLTMPLEMKASVLPNLPAWLHGVVLSFPVAMIVTMAIVGLVAFLFGLVIARLPSNSAAIATLGVMVIIHVVLIGAEDYTRGSQTFYGIPQATNLPVVLVVAVFALLGARLFRESTFGLRLRAVREDELAARSFGADVWRLRLLAFVVSSMICGAAGVLFAHFITAFSPKAFYFTMTLDYLVMLIIGGGSTVVGPVAGAILVNVVRELLRPVESGLHIGPFGWENFFGLSQVVMALAMLVTMYYDRNGLLGLRELDERLIAWASSLSKTDEGDLT